MAIVTCFNKKGKYCDATSRYDVINYIMNPDKVKHGICGGVFVNMDSPAEDMAATARLYGKDTGVRLRHFIVSFSDFDDVRLSKLGALAYDLASVIANRYQVVYAVHENTDMLHIHFVFNSVSHIDGERFGGTRKEFYYLMTALRNALIRNHIYELYYMSTPLTE